MEYKSAARRSFEHYLRTGRWLAVEAGPATSGQKFNPYHDPRNGRFTFAPGGPRSLSHVIISDRRYGRVDAAKLPSASSSPDTRPNAQSNTSQPREAARLTEAVYRLEGSSIAPELVQYRPNPRARIGGNGGPRLNDPMTLERVFPGLSSSPAGSLLAVVDNIFDLTGPATRLTTELTEAHVNLLIGQIRTIDPNYRLDTLGFPTTLEGQANLIRQLRLDRAAAFYRVRGEIRPLQVETLRYLQERTDKAYEQGVIEYERGRLNVRLSREEAIGNYVDRTVRSKLQNLYNRLGIKTSTTGPIRIIGREYSISGTDRTYRIPDARVGNIAFDVSLTRKTLNTPQVRGFFNSDFKPNSVIIVRPSQLGPNSTYAITRPRKQP